MTSPLLLNAIGSDLHRWNAQAALNAGLAALMLMPTTPAPVERRSPASPRGLAWALIAAAWSVSADPIFFDGYTPAHPPFASQIQFLVEAIRSPNSAMWILRIDVP